MNKFAWIEPRATAILQRLESEQTLKIDKDTADELVPLDKLALRHTNPRATPRHNPDSGWNSIVQDCLHHTSVVSPN